MKYLDIMLIVPVSHKFISTGGSVLKPFHTTIGQLSGPQCLDLLRSNDMCHIGCIDNGSPYIYPVSYIFEDGCIYCHSRHGKKLQILNDVSQVCVQVENITDFFNWKSVMGWGQFEELRGEEAYSYLRLMVKKMNPDHLSSTELDFTSVLFCDTVYRIRLVRVTGAFESYTASDA